MSGLYLPGYTFTLEDTFHLFFKGLLAALALGEE